MISSVAMNVESSNSDDNSWTSKRVFGRVMKRKGEFGRVMKLKGEFDQVKNFYDRKKEKPLCLYAYEDHLLIL